MKKENRHTQHTYKHTHPWFICENLKIKNVWKERNEARFVFMQLIYSTYTHIQTFLHAVNQFFYLPILKIFALRRLSLGRRNEPLNQKKEKHKKDVPNQQPSATHHNMEISKHNINTTHTYTYISTRNTHVCGVYGEREWILIIFSELVFIHRLRCQRRWKMYFYEVSFLETWSC
jgi:hypothetical protein